jgi:hypothetical protein
MRYRNAALNSSFSLKSTKKAAIKTFIFVHFLLVKTLNMTARHDFRNFIKLRH